MILTTPSTISPEFVAITCLSVRVQTPEGESATQISSQTNSLDHHSSNDSRIRRDINFVGDSRCALKAFDESRVRFTKRVEWLRRSFPRQPFRLGWRVEETALLAKYLYERGDGRFKHCWKKPQAGFEPGKRGAIGKCSSKITLEVAQTLLDEGIPHNDDEDDQHPARIYNVFDGVPYEATHTQRGVSYHGYPWRGRMPKRILRVLESRAEAQGHGKEFKEWIKQYAENDR